MIASTAYSRFGTRMTELLLRHRVLTLVVGLLVFALIATGARKLAFSTDYRVFFSREDTGLAAFERLETTFKKTDNVLFVVKSDRGSVFAGDALEAVRELSDAAIKLPFAARVDSITNFRRATADGEGGDDLKVDTIVPDGPIDDAVRARAMRLATTEPILVGSLLAKDSATTGVNVSLDLPRKKPSEVSDTIGAARVLLQTVKARHPSLDIRLSGMAAVNHAFMETSVKDLGVMFPLMLVGMLLTMGILLRSAWATAAVAVVILIAGGSSLAVAGWLGYPLTPPTVAAPMMVLTVVIADGVHVVLATMEGLGAGMGRRRAIIRAISANLEALTYTWLTTVVGFVCLNSSEAPPVNHLAKMTSVGVTIAFVYSVTFLPALLACLPLGDLREPVPGATPAPGVKARVAAAETETTSSRLLGGLSRFVVRHRHKVLLAAAAVTVLFGLAASRLRTNDQFVQYFDKSTAFRADADFTLKNLSGIYRVEFELPSSGPDSVTDPAYLASVEAFATYLRAQPEVDHVFSFADIMKRLVSATHGDRAEEYRLPATRGEAGELVLLYEMALPPGADLTDRVSLDKSRTRLSVILQDMSSRQMSDFAARAEGWARDHAPAMATEATGPVVIFSALSDRNARGMLRADFLSLGLISLCMILVLRSVRLGILSVVPNVVPIVIGYGIWWFGVGQMNVVATVAGSISLGVIVDDTIHFLTRFRVEMARPGMKVETALEHTLAHAGPAMLSTSVILVFGFGVLCFSSFQMTSYLGWLSVIIVAVAPLADLVLVPALVVTFLSPQASPSASRDAVPDPSSLETITSVGASS